MLDEWLASADRNPAPYSDFEVVDVAEVDQPSDAVLDHVSGLLRNARVDPAFFRAAAVNLGWEDVDAWLEDSVPAGTTARRGQFGEVLSAAVLEEFHDYVVPVRKLRYAITAGQSLPSTDVLALLVDEDGEIQDVCFVEAKLRTGADSAFAAMGYRQLRDDYAKRLPDILRFTAERLHESVDGLFDPFMAYLARRDDAGIDTFRLFLVQDVDAWSETTLENLNDEPVELDELTVHVVLLASLADLTDALFAGIGVTSVIDDD
jgi:Cap4 SAVED domain